MGSSVVTPSIIRGLGVVVIESLSMMFCHVDVYFLPRFPYKKFSPHFHVHYYSSLIAKLSQPVCVCVSVI